MIKGVSEIRRIPRLGKIRLGIKKESAKGASYPSEVDYFILDPETPDQKRRDELIAQFKELYGDRPKAIKIMLPPADPELFFKQNYKRYGSGSLLKCLGDGEIAETMPDFAEGLEIIGETDRGFIQVKCLGPECPYQNGPKKQCARMASLQVILPELKGIGVFQINTGSFNSIVNINSAIEWIKGLCGRYAMIPLTLMRVPQDIAYEGKKSKHYILQIDQSISIGEIQKFASITPIERALIPAPDESKDELFYDANGKKPEIAGPEEQKTAVNGPTIDAEVKTASVQGGAVTFAPPLESAALEPTPAPVSKPKGPLTQAYEDGQKSRKVYNDLQVAMKTMKTRKDVADYCEKLKTEGFFDKISQEHREELKRWASAYMKGLKS